MWESGVWGEMIWGGNRVWLNNGAGGFTDTGQSHEDSLSRSVALADFNSDGTLDMVVGNALVGHRLYLSE